MAVSTGKFPMESSVSPFVRQWQQVVPYRVIAIQ